MLKYQLRRVTQFWGLKNGSNGKKQTSRGGSTGNPSPPPQNRDVVGSEGSVDNMGYNTKEEEYVYYMLAPPWARHKEPILYL